MTVKHPVVTPIPARKGPSVVQKTRTDWQAVGRDFRTASFTLRELAEKYGISHQAIAKQRIESAQAEFMTNQPVAIIDKAQAAIKIVDQPSLFEAA